MRLCLTVACLVVIAASSVRAATNCGTPFEADFRSGSDLTLDLRAGDIEVAGVDAPVVRVECIVSEDARDIRIDFDSTRGKLSIDGGPANNVKIRVEVPKQSNITVRCTAGDLRVRGIRGHKDIRLRAGDLTIEAGDPSEYSSVEAWVTAGDLRASAFGVHKGGLFRSFKHHRAGGKYRLKASLWAGDIELR